MDLEKQLEVSLLSSVPALGTQVASPSLGAPTLMSIKLCLVLRVIQVFQGNFAQIYGF